MIEQRCKFGTGKTLIKDCLSIYLHWKGYYPTEESFQLTLKLLCPNYVEPTTIKNKE